MRCCPWKGCNRTTQEDWQSKIGDRLQKGSKERCQASGIVLSPGTCTVLSPWGSFSFSTHHWLLLFSALSLILFSLPSKCSPKMISSIPVASITACEFWQLSKLNPHFRYLFLNISWMSQKHLKFNRFKLKQTSFLLLAPVLYPTSPRQPVSFVLFLSSLKRNNK